MRRKPEIRAVTTTARAEFPGQQSDQRKSGPLTKAKGFEQLLLGVLDGKAD
jgi:hypothetical protein